MFIANKGSTKTKIYNNNEYKSNDIKWDAKYDGKNADINLDVDNNGEKKHLHMNLTNDEMAKLLNIPSIGVDLQKRLKNDFKYDLKKPRFIELEDDNETSSNTFEPWTNPDLRYRKKFSVKRKNKKRNIFKTRRSYI